MRRRGRYLGLVCALWAALAPSGGIAQPERRRVVLVAPGAELARASRAALEPWQLEVVVVSGPSPGATAPSVHSSARDLAAARRAAAVVWVAGDPSGYALWLYDLSADQAFARPLASAPPFDGPAAAALALSIKTLLRHSATAPAGQRYGADTGASDGAAAQGEPLPRQGDERAALQVVLTPTERARALPARASTFDFEAAGGLRSQFTRARSVEARFGAGAIVWPRAGWAGVSLRAIAGPALRVEHARLRARLIDTSLGLSGQLRWELARSLRLCAAFGPALDVTVLEGAEPEQRARTIRALRAVPSLALELGGDWTVSPRFRLGVRAAGAWLLRAQRYLLRGEPVLELSRGNLEVRLVLAVMGGA